MKSHFKIFRLHLNLVNEWSGLSHVFKMNLYAKCIWSELYVIEANILLLINLVATRNYNRSILSPEDSMLKKKVGGSPLMLLCSVSMFCFDSVMFLKFVPVHCLLWNIFSSVLNLVSWFLTATFRPLAARLRAPLLPSVHTDTWPQLCNDLRLPGPQASEGGAGDRMCPLRLQGLCQRWLILSSCCWAYDSSSQPNHMRCLVSMDRLLWLAWMYCGN